MVTFITILQVNLVMSILLYVMFLAYLYGISASTMDKQRPMQDPISALIIKLLQADISRQKQGDVIPSSTLNVSTVADYKEKDNNTPMVDSSEELLRQYKRYNSPRVLLSDRPPMQPPAFYLMDKFISGQDSNKTRQKRFAEHKSYRGEFSVCDSESNWVTNRTSAVDSRGNHVTVLNSFTVKQKYTQYFYETKCKTPHSHRKSRCLGIDEKHWNSQCKTTQTYVRALTQHKSLVSWNWIRIDTACVCALSKKHRRT
ncbi:neurotrophin-3 [Danio rerio]|uniref:Neurotrophin-3 n=1 Tax=Danio rerio TaxID=7955 RepID=A0A8M1P3S4_DANRE|nr:neurotrophin-3 [Danio rerio]|eukprot:NP_001314742.1 neurotrophin-3 [Danio rerio]